MDFTRFENNALSLLKEAQIKLGYEKTYVGVNYIMPTLRHLFGNCSDAEVEKYLNDFIEYEKTNLGEITITKIDDGYRLTFSPKIIQYVHDSTNSDEFIVKFIETVRGISCTIEDIKAVFNMYSDNVVFRRVVNDEFDYLIYFKDFMPDEFVYCIDTKDLGTTYHRLIREDYNDLGFEPYV